MLPEAHRVPVWVMPTVKAAIILLDALLATGSFIAAFKFRGGDPVFSVSAWAWSKEFVPYAGILFFLVPVRIAMLLYQRAYRMHGAFSYTVEAIKIFKAVSVSSLLAIAWAFLFRGGFAFREFFIFPGDLSIRFSASAFSHYRAAHASALCPKQGFGRTTSISSRHS